MGEVKTGGNPDAVVYDPAVKKVFAFNGRSKDVTVFDAVSGKLERTLPLRGKPEYAAADGKGKVYVNIEDANRVVEIDSAMVHVSRRFSLKSCHEPTGLGLDPEKHRLFSGCHNKVMTVLDTTSGKIIATLPVGEKVDANGFDAGTGLIFSSNGDGTLTIAQELSSGNFKVIDTVITQRGSRTMAIDPKTHRIYLPAAQFSEPKESATDGIRPRPVMVPGSFEILVVGK